MNRPSRVRNSPGVHGYAVAPALAWSGWRLMVRGGPEGGQYHGYTGDDSDQETTTLPNIVPNLSGPPNPWNPVWSGTALKEGQSRSDYVYRGPGEVRPRSNASGGVNTFYEFQTKRSAGYGVAPGNYRALGAMISVAEAVGRGLISDPCAGLVGVGAENCRNGISQQSYFVPDPTPPPVAVAPTPAPAPPVSVSPSDGWPAGGTEPPLPSPPFGGRVCPDYQLACPPGSTVVYGNDACQTPVGCQAAPGAAPPVQSVAAPISSPVGPILVNTVAQPVSDLPLMPNTVSLTTIPPVSPAPAPVVAASAADYLPAVGQPLPGSPEAAAVATSAAGSVDIGAWLASSSIWSAVPNWVLLAGGGLLLFSSMKGKR